MATLFINVAVFFSLRVFWFCFFGFFFLHYFSTNITKHHNYELQWCTIIEEISVSDMRKKAHKSLKNLSHLSATLLNWCRLNWRLNYHKKKETSRNELQGNVLELSGNYLVACKFSVRHSVLIWSLFLTYLDLSLPRVYYNSIDLYLKFFALTKLFQKVFTLFRRQFICTLTQLVVSS